MSELSEKQSMTRAEVFAALASHGAERAVVAFSGGNDEGGPDSITLFAGEREVSSLSTWPTGVRTAEEQAKDRLADGLSEPVFEEYHTFAGDFDVTGEVIWTVDGSTVTMIKDERADYEHSEELL